MTLSTVFRMPDGFHADAARQGLFRPPASSPSAGSGYLPAARPAPAVVDATTPERRRNRLGGNDVSHAFDGPHDSLAAVLGPPAPISAPAYALAGQLDTSHAIDNRGLEESTYSNADYRKVLGSKRPRDNGESTGPSRRISLSALPAQPTPSRNWSSAAISTIGGVVGRVWEFCTAGAFKGFYAGGGTAYDMDTAADDIIGSPRCGVTAADEQRIPGCYPRGDGCDNEAAEDVYDDTRPSTPTTPTSPAAKRRQTGRSADELTRNWIMVREPATRTSQQSPRNRNQAPAITTGRRISTPNRRSLASFSATPREFQKSASASPAPALSRPASCASFASPRPSTPVKTASRVQSNTASPTHLASHARRRSLIPQPSQSSGSHRRTHSNASTASCTAPEGLDASPRLNAEAKMLATRRKMEDRDADVRIAAFNKRLQDMIRQGKEALGTTMEVEGGDGNRSDEAASWVDEADA